MFLFQERGSGISILENAMFYHGVSQAEGKHDGNRAKLFKTMEIPRRVTQKNSTNTEGYFCCIYKIQIVHLPVIYTCSVLPPSVSSGISAVG
jgi:hypothetical protein